MIRASASIHPFIWERRPRRTVFFFAPRFFRSMSHKSVFDARASAFAPAVATADGSALAADGCLA